MISHSQIYRAGAALATHYYADQADDYYRRDGSAATWPGEGARPPMCDFADLIDAA